VELDGTIALHIGGRRGDFAIHKLYQCSLNGAIPIPPTTSPSISTTQ
jgi:hypothetical protein